uniref:Uncharacterized protein n=1 Tax=Oreochromis aureus TaxID=47969 RepID=A0A668RV29_OREAU
MQGQMLREIEKKNEKKELYLRLYSLCRNYEIKISGYNVRLSPNKSASETIVWIFYHGILRWSEGGGSTTTMAMIDAVSLPCYKANTHSLVYCSIWCFLRSYFNTVAGEQIVFTVSVPYLFMG